ncbi:MAG: hypothetical protein JNK72_17960 [Myxococcales bacterium]|nr:hypothetical protein [Myxococcales bacterium]
MSQQKGNDAKVFVRDGTVDAPGTVGARWWNQALIEEDRDMSRRAALKGLAVGAVALSAVAGAGALVYEAIEPDYQFERRDSLLMQRTFGWAFSANGVTLKPETTSAVSAFRPDVIATLERDLAPSRWLPFHVPTLLQSMTAAPTGQLRGRSAGARVLPNELSVLPTPTMNWAFASGSALATLFRDVPVPVAVLVDLDGAESVAFAAGASSVFEPVFLLDNWPHPLGLSPAQNALTAAVYYRDLFVGNRDLRGATPPPIFVLDRTRLTEFSGEQESFDNRYVGRVPSGASLRNAGITRALYVIDGAGQLPEREDLNDTLVGWSQSGIDLRALSASSFRANYEAVGSHQPSSPKYYGGDVSTHPSFWQHYPWAQLPPGMIAQPPDDPQVTGHAFVPRVTRFSRGAKPPAFASVEVAVHIESRQIMGASFDRDGTWNRMSSSGSSSRSSSSTRGGWWGWGGG